jgi:hypothetical protein
MPRPGFRCTSAATLAGLRAVCYRVVALTPPDAVQ